MQRFEAVVVSLVACLLLFWWLCVCVCVCVCVCACVLGGEVEGFRVEAEFSNCGSIWFALCLRRLITRVCVGRVMGVMLVVLMLVQGK